MTRSGNDLAQHRRRQLAEIHIAKAQLRMDDDTYREMLARVSADFGVEQRSAADLDDVQRNAVIRELRRMGSVAKPGAPARKRYPGKPRNFDQLPAMVTKVEALLADIESAWIAITPGGAPVPAGVAP